MQDKLHKATPYYIQMIIDQARLKSKCKTGKIVGFGQRNTGFHVP
jgi:hypothetical protein